MQDDGVLAGDRVLIVAENCPVHVALGIGCNRIGAWSCGVNARMAPAEIAVFADNADRRVMYFTPKTSANSDALHDRRPGRRTIPSDTMTSAAERSGGIASTQ